MRNLRVGLIGQGMMGKNHLRILTTLNGIELVGVADPIYIDNSSGKFSYSLYADYKDLLSQNLDYCVIAAPTGYHKEIAINALSNGVNCLIEKPVAVNFADAQAIQVVANKQNLLVGIGHIERYNAAIRELRKRLLDGELGSIYQISIRRQGPFPSRIADVGVVKDLATHDIDLVMWLSGSRFSNINAQTAHRSGRKYEDLVSINGQLENKTIINVLVNWLSPLKERSIVVTGEKGAFVVDTLNSDLTFYENGIHEVSQDAYLLFKGVSQGNVTTFAFEKPEPLLVEHQQFRDKLLGKEADIVSLAEGVETVRIADAILESSEKNQRIIL
ncbi:MviM Predicted dehydrogenases and related proteins [Candidatus Nanopelagicaceae bacterium]